MLLLDTHVLLWLAEGMEDLPPSARQFIDEAAMARGLAISSISFWEIAMLDLRGRISLSRPIGDWRRRVLDERSGVVSLDVTTRESGFEFRPGSSRPSPVSW